MLLSSLRLGEAVPDVAVAGAARRDEGPLVVFDLREGEGAERASWELLTRDERLVRVTLDRVGDWEALADAYTSLVAELTTRHGPPTTTDAPADHLRDVDLPAEGLPCDRCFVLRSCTWSAPTSRVVAGQPALRASVTLYKVWPSELRLTLSAELR